VIINMRVYECKIVALCQTDRNMNFTETFAICSTREKGRLYTKGYLLEEWKYRGYDFIKDKIIPYHPGHIYYVIKGSERWELYTYVIERKLDSLWYLEEDEDE